MPPEVCELDMIETLILHENGLPSLRMEVGDMTNLTQLSLTGNYLAGAWACVCVFACVRVLSLDGQLPRRCVCVCVR